MFKETTVEGNLDRDAWLERRMIGIGSSDAPAILGISPYKSALQLYHEKRGVLPPHRAEIEQLRWGNILERPIAQRYAEETERQVEHLADPHKYTLLRHRERIWQHASLDGIVFAHAGAMTAPGPGVGVLEVKNASSYVGERWKDEPPVEFLVQLQHQLAVTGAAWGSIAALIGGVMFVWQDIARDQAFIDKLTELELLFSERIVAGNPPEPDGTEHARAFLNWLYPKDTGEIIQLPPTMIDVANDYAHAKTEIKGWEERKRAAENQIIAAIGDAALGVLPNGDQFSYKLQSRKAFTVAENSFRVLRMKGTKRAIAIAIGPGQGLALPEYRDGGGDDPE
jgi:putative phage-type endonuclease